MKAEDIDNLLNAILASTWFKEEQKNRDLKDEVDFYGHRLRTVEFEVDTLHSFFEQPAEEVLKIKAFVSFVKEEIQSEVESVLDEFPDTLDWDMQEEIQNTLNGLRSDLESMLKKRHRDSWSQLTREEGIDRLKKGKVTGRMVILLDAQDHHIDEPYPTIQTDSKTTIEIKQDNVLKCDKILVAFNPPVKTPHADQISGAYLCTKPENFSKAEIITLP